MHITPVRYTHEKRSNRSAQRKERAEFKKYQGIGAVRDSKSTYRRGLVKRDEGYALVYVLLLVAVLSITSAALLNSELISRDSASRAVDSEQAIYAANDGVRAALAIPLADGIVDTTFSMRFADSALAIVKVYRWGLYEGVFSTGSSNHSRATRSALIASRLTAEDGPALVLGNIQHGLTLTGSAEIVGNVEVGPRGATTGSMKNEIQPTELPIRGDVLTSSMKRQMVRGSMIMNQVMLAKSLLLISHRRRLDLDPSGELVDTTGYVNLSNLSRSVDELFSAGNLKLAGSIMRRGPPLEIVALGHLTFIPGLNLNGFIAVLSRDSILIPSNVELNNCVVVSCKSISLGENASVRSQLFSPVIRCSSSSSAYYPSLCVSAGFSDTSGVVQSIVLSEGARIAGSVIMDAGKGITLAKAVIDLKAGSVVTGGVFTNGYLTMDGTVKGMVRAYDLYFYELPTTYIGWMRKGRINRKELSGSFLNPVGISGTSRNEVLAWL